jgi:hypothetical protein
MRATFDFDFMKQSWGPATFALQQIFHEWAAVDWFGTGTASPDRGLELFREHMARARALDPDRFPADFQLHASTCSAREFDERCVRVRAPPIDWDWKMSALKSLATMHARQRGWDRVEQARELQPDRQATPGDLYVRMPQAAIWAARPNLTIGPTPAEAAWYYGYVVGDFADCIEWQLAERSSDLSGNPFFPLVLCYVAGLYPFSYGRESFELCALGSRPA